jgi:hypothetical protein
LGVRAGFEGVVGILDPAEIELLKKLAEVADTFVSKLPGVEEGRGSKGPFEEIFDRQTSHAFRVSVNEA